jgi:enediyne biosynthesis protein E3
MLVASLRRALLSVPARDRDFTRLGFSEGIGWGKLKDASDAFFAGYHAALSECDLVKLAASLDEYAPEVRGLAYEGAAGALAIMDRVMPWRGDQWGKFLNGPAADHASMIYAGAGLGLAHLPWMKIRIEKAASKIHPLFRWAVLDGYGFHEGFFHWQRCVVRKAVDKRLSAYARRAFDQGLGRCLWFGCGGDAVRVAGMIAAFPESRRSDLWSGAGAASTYAGAVDRTAIEAVTRECGPYGRHVAQGAAIAAHARYQGHNPCAHTEMACRVLCGVPADQAARIVDECMENLPPDGAEPAYEFWRRRIQERLAVRLVHR